MIPLWTLIIVLQINGQSQRIEIGGFVSAHACHLAAGRVERDPPQFTQIRCVQT
jgi:hypothetical protein